MEFLAASLRDMAWTLAQGLSWIDSACVPGDLHLHLVQSTPPDDVAVALVVLVHRKPLHEKV